MAALLIAPFASVELGTEPSRPSPSLGLATRKELGDDLQVEAAQPLPTLGTLFNTHSGEAVPLSAEEPSPERFATFLEDRVTGSSTAIDPVLLGLLRKLAKDRPPARIDIVSGYRSWKLNEQLRKKGRRVASHSQHSLGNAVDFRIEGMTTKQLREAIEDGGWNGGIGYYPNANDRFVHADAGPKRHWVGH
ncbi:MAG: DUF882 domain-containing protein [Deltaproteobacteria bacterium]|nr:DUF882 domain-containing protein [Deltaproteobacteria bacterium]